MRKSRKYYFLISFIPLVAFFILIVFIAAYFITNEHINLEVLRAGNAVELEAQFFNQTMNDALADLFFLRNEAAHLIGNSGTTLSKNTMANLANLFYSFSSYKERYHQIRFIDPAGKEGVRIKNTDNQSKLVPMNFLQDKSGRYYFQKTIPLQNNAVYYSPLDLSVENNQVEIPFVPVVRLGTTIFNKQGRLMGVLILNVNESNFIHQLKVLSRHNKGDLLLMTEEGHILLGLNPNNEWGNSISARANKTVKNIYPQLWTKLQDGNASKIITIRGIYLIHPITAPQGQVNHSDLKLRLIWFLPWKELLFPTMAYSIYALFLLFFLSFIIAWFWSLFKSAQIKHEKQLNYLAKTDSLTHLPNRHELMRVGELEVERAKRHNASFCVLMLDIDHFKEINDDYGHLVGDKFLIEAAKACQMVIRKIDFLARFGGDEIVILLPHTPLSAGRKLAERLRHAIEKITIESTVHSSISIGMSIWHNADQSIDDVVKRADDNLYRAKAKGRNCIVGDNP